MEISVENMLKCNNCRQDVYDEKISQLILFIESNLFSQRVLQIEDKNEKYEEKERIRMETKKFTILYCQWGSKHLYNGSRKVLMCYETYNIVNELHEDSHMSPDKAIEVLKTIPIYYENIVQFVHEFIFICPFCSNRLQPSSDISFSHSIWKILFSKFKINIPPKCSFLALDKIKTEPCNPQCLEDHYDREFEICLYILKHKKLPPLPRGEGTKIHRLRLYKKSKKYRIIPCISGKDHLWLRNGQKKILMMNEARNLASILHGEEHRNKKVMGELLLKQETIYPYCMKKYIHEVVDQCLFCSPKVSKPQNLEDYEDKEDIYEKGHKNDDEKKEEDMNYKIVHREFTKISELGKVQKQNLRKKILWNEQIDSDPSLLAYKIDSVPIWDDIMSLKDSISKEFHISSLTAEMAINDLHWSHADQAQLTQKLSQHPEIMYKQIEEEKVLKVAVISNSKMKKNYHCFGDCLSIDYVSKIIKKRDPAGRHFQVGFFTGQNKEGKIIIFGLSLLSSEIFVYHKKAFELFFEMMENKIPHCIMSCDSRQLFKALQILKEEKKYQYEYYINWFYVIEFLKKHAHHELEKYKILQIFCQALQAPIQQQYRENMVKLRSQIVGTQVYSEFDKVGQLFCLSKIKPAFIGFSIGSNHVEELYGLLQNGLEYHPKLSMFYSNIFQIQKQIQRNEKQKPENVASNKQMEDISKYLFHQCWIQLQNSYKAVENFILIESLSDYDQKFRIKDRDKCCYTVEYSLVHNCWLCNCKMIYFTGLPCSHLIFIILKFGGSLQYYINSRWTYEFCFMEQKQQELSKHEQSIFSLECEDW